MWNKKVQKLAAQQKDGLLPSILFPYAVYYVDNDGSIICADCANEDRYEDSIWDIVDYGVDNMDHVGRDSDEYETCQNCYRAIDPALRENIDS